MDRAVESHHYPPWTSKIGPAPGDLRIVQAFVNTRDVDLNRDELETTDGLVSWLRTWRLLGRGSTVHPTDRSLAVDLREGLRELLLANNGDRGAASRLEGLDRGLARLSLRCALDPHGRFDLVAVSDGWPRAGARILTITIRAMAAGVWARLKACRRDECQWAFFDSSKNRSATWCSMAGCGDLMKARAYRQRLRSRTRKGRAKRA